MSLKLFRPDKTDHSTRYSPPLLSLLAAGNKSVGLSIPCGPPPPPPRPPPPPVNYHR